MQNKNEYKDLSLLYESIYEEGILSRAGARIAGVKAATGQYFKNIGNTVVGKAAPVGASQAAADAKTQYAFRAAAKNLLNDLQKLGLLPKGPVPVQAEQQVQTALNDMIQQMNPAPAPTQQQAAQEPAEQQSQQQKPPVTEPTQQPAAPQTSPTKRSRKRKPASKPPQEGFEPVGSSGVKTRKVYNQSDEELTPLPNTFEYFGN